MLYLETNQLNHGSYLESNIDVHALVRALRIVLKVVHTEPLSDHLIFNDPKTQPNADKTSMYWLADQDPETLTDEEIEEWVRMNAGTLFHPVSFHLLHVPCWPIPTFNRLVHAVSQTHHQLGSSTLLFVSSGLKICAYVTPQSSPHKLLLIQ